MALHASATDAINDSLLMYMEVCNIHVGANVLSEVNHVECQWSTCEGARWKKSEGRMK
jgi:hypothetical protein